MIFGQERTWSNVHGTTGRLEERVRGKGWQIRHLNATQHTGSALVVLFLVLLSYNAREP